MNTEYTEEQKEQVIEARNNNYSYKEIRDEFGVPKSTAQRWCDAAGVQRKVTGEKIYPKEIRNHARRLRYTNGMEYQEIANIIGCSIRSVKDWCNTIDDVEELEEDLIKENVRLAKNHQRITDKNRIERGAFREYARAETMLEELTDKLTYVIDKNKFSNNQEAFRKLDNLEEGTGVIQLSDCHFNELIRDTNLCNRFDIEIASKRIRKHVLRCLNKFDNEVNHVLFALTGDLLNSDRRISEITEAATTRAKALFLATDIISGSINEVLHHGYDVTVCSVTGNESRIKDYIDTTDYLASDSYDITIHLLLEKLYQTVPTVTFSKITDPIEHVIKINDNFNLLMLHGHLHKGLARNANIEKEVELVKSRYASQGVVIDYVICGHIHQAYISDFFSRSGGLPGGNSYSQRALNLNSRASQNGFIIHKDGSIDGFKNDLQNIDNITGYKYNKELVEYDSSRKNGTVEIVMTSLV